MERKQILKLVLVALFTALITAGAYIKIPVGPVPVSLCTFFVNLAASCLPLSLALATVLVYLFLGIIGLPVFTSGGGLAALMGPTGGYLVGYIPSVVFGALVMKLRGKNIRIASFLSAVVSTVFFYVVGLPWLSLMLDLPLSGTLGAGLFPFIFGDVLKIIVATLVTPSVRSRVKELLECEE